MGSQNPHGARDADLAERIRRRFAQDCPVPGRVQDALVRAAIADPKCADRIRSALRTRSILDEDHASVFHSLSRALELTAHEAPPFDVIEDLHGSKLPAWATTPEPPDLKKFWTARLAAAFAEYDKALLRALLDAATADLSKEGAIAPRTRQAIEGALRLPSAEHVTRRRATDHRSIINRLRETSPRIDRFVPTGFRTLDLATGWDWVPHGEHHVANPRFPGGFTKDSLVLVGAQSGHGKTTFCVELVLRSVYLWNAVRGEHRCGIVVSEEQKSDDLVRKFGLNDHGVWGRFINPTMNDIHFLDSRDYGEPSVEAVVAAVVDRCQEIILSGREQTLTTEEIKARLPLVLVVDYAKLFAPGGMSLVQGIDSVGRNLRNAFARGDAFAALRYPELEGYTLPVVLPTQVALPKARARDTSWRPTDDDLEDCRSIREHADMILLIVKDEDHDHNGIRHLKLSKSRVGATDWGWWPMYSPGQFWFEDEAEMRDGPPVAWYRERYETAIREREEGRRRAEEARGAAKEPPGR